MQGLTGEMVSLPATHQVSIGICEAAPTGVNNEDVVGRGDDSTRVASATPLRQASFRHRSRAARVSRPGQDSTRGATIERGTGNTHRPGVIEPARVVDVHEAATLPPLQAVDVLATDLLPAFIGGTEALKVRALARLLGSSVTAGHTEVDDGFLTVPEVATRLSLTDQYVYEMIRTGDLPAIEIGPKKYKRVALADLRAWAASKKVDQPSYAAYSWPSERLRSATTAQATRANSTRTRGPRRRGTEQRGEVGTRRDRDQGVSGTPDATPCEATEAPTWQEEYLTDGVH